MLSKASRGHSSSALLFPGLAMRDFVSCFGDHAVRVAGTTCGTGGASVPDRPLQNAITSFYRVVLSTGKELVIKVTWSRDANLGALASLEVGDVDCWRAQGSGSNRYPLRKKGSRSFLTGKSVVSLHWDVSVAKYASGPEPVKDFYVIVVADAEFGLLLGDACGEFVRKFEDSVPVAASSMFGRRERVHAGAALCSTRARFRCDGKEHEISIRCRGDNCDDAESAERAELTVCVDKKRLVDVRSARWNFRGNQTILVDDTAVDVMWDLHGWWFGGASGAALFMFRTRSSLESRLWLVDEELAQAQGTMSSFSLLIEAFKNQ